jgi:hypothetical protein
MGLPKLVGGVVIEAGYMAPLAPQGGIRLFSPGGDSGSFHPPLESA